MKHDDVIHIWIKDDNGHILEDFGKCLTSSPSRALEMYADELQAWTDKGYKADLHWDWEDDVKRAAAKLGRMKSDRKAKSSAENGKLGGRPKSKEKGDA